MKYVDTYKGVLRDNCGLTYTETVYTGLSIEAVQAAIQARITSLYNSRFAFPKLLNPGDKYTTNSTSRFGRYAHSIRIENGDTRVRVGSQTHANLIANVDIQYYTGCYDM